MFKGLQRDFPFAIMSKDPPTALLWLTSWQLLLLAEYAESLFEKADFNLPATAEAESLHTSRKPMKSPYIVRALQVYLHHEKPCKVYLYPARLKVSPYLRNGSAISLRAMSLRVFEQSISLRTDRKRCESFCSTYEPMSSPTSPKSLNNLPAPDKPCEFLSNQSPCGLPAKCLRSFCSTYEPTEFPTIPKRLDNLPAADEPASF